MSEPTRHLYTVDVDEEAQARVEHPPTWASLWRGLPPSMQAAAIVCGLLMFYAACVGVAWVVGPRHADAWGNGLAAEAILGTMWGITYVFVRATE